MLLFVLTFVLIVVLYHTVKSRHEKRNFHLIEIKKSTRPGAGLGAFATQDIPAGLDLGRYYGVLVNEEPEDSTYTWQLDSDHVDILGRPYHVQKFIDGKTFIENNPLRYVNSPIGKDEDWLINTVEKQKGSARDGCVHYYTNRKIKKGEELFVDYGEIYRTWMEQK